MTEGKTPDVTERKRLRIDRNRSLRKRPMLRDGPKKAKKKIKRKAISRATLCCTQI